MEPRYLGSDCQLSLGFCVTQPWMLLGNKGSQWASSSVLQLCRKPGNYQHSVIPLLSFASTVPAGDVCMQYWCVCVCVYRTGELHASSLCSCGLILGSLNTVICVLGCAFLWSRLLICVMKWAYQFLTFLNDTERNFLCDVPFSFFSALMRNVDIWTLLFFCCDHQLRTILKWDSCCFFARELKAHVTGDHFRIRI